MRKDNPLFIAACGKIDEMGIEEFMRQSRFQPEDLNNFLDGAIEPVYAMCLSRVLPYSIDEIYQLAQGSNITPSI